MLAYAGAAMIACVQPAGPAALDEGLRARLEEIDRGIARVEDLRAEFEQTRATPLLRKPLESSGTVAVKGDRVRWDTRRPGRSSMTIGGGEVRLYFPDERVLEVYEAEGDLRELTGSPLPRLESLGARFALAPMAPSAIGGEDGNAQLVGVELTPRGEELREHLARVRVVLDARVPCVSRIELTDPDGETTLVVFKNVKVNGGVADEDLQLRVPDGVEVIRPMGGSGPPPP